ncbi:MAG TPA: methionyl-tRNA formyltransferase [Firmicutes bacterium]|nr:methionyl-tRNA formyltransferase [Bacillota bacterium]
MRLVFMGTPEFAVPSLESLIQRHNVASVVTQPDRPSGRGQRVDSSPVKRLAQGHGISVLQPRDVKDPRFIKEISGLNPEAIVVVAFGQKIPGDLLRLPKFGCINVHASLLPKYRGAAPIQWAILNGEPKTGVTTMLMDEGWDTGDILLQREVPIRDDMTAGELHDILACEGACLLLETIEKLERGTLRPMPQADEKATMAPKLTKEMAKIDWSLPASRIHNLVRAMAPSPGAFAFLDGERIKILKVQVLSEEDEPRISDGFGCAQAPGQVVEVDRNRGITVSTGKGLLRLLEIQPEGGRRMEVQAFILGHRISQTMRFG